MHQNRSEERDLCLFRPCHHDFLTNANKVSSCSRVMGDVVHQMKDQVDETHKLAISNEGVFSMAVRQSPAVNCIVADQVIGHNCHILVGPGPTRNPSLRTRQTSTSQPFRAVCPRYYNPTRATSCSMRDCSLVLDLAPRACNQ